MTDAFRDQGVTFWHKGERYHYSLARFINNPYEINPRPMFGTSILTGEADYTNMRPDEVIPLVIQNDWRKGFQDEDYEDSKRYAHSLNCDARFKGKVLLSPKSSTVSFSNLQPNITDGGFEAWDDATHLTNWTELTGLPTRNESPRTGTYCVEFYTTNPGTEDIYQDIAWDDAYQGKHFVFDVYYSTSNTWADTTLNVIIDDGVGTTTTATTTKSYGSWTRLRVNRTLDSAATQLRFKIQHVSTSASDIYSYWDDASLPEVSGTPLKIITFGEYLVAAIGEFLIWSDDGATWNMGYGFNEDITDLCVFKNYLHILLGASDEAWYTSDLSTFTESALYGGDTTKHTTLAEAITSVATTFSVADRSVFTGDTAYAIIDEDEDTEEIVQIDDADEPDPAGITVDRAELGTTAYAHASGATIREIAAMSGAIYMANCGDRICAVADTTTTIRTSDNPINDGTPFSTPITVPNSTYTITDMVDDPNGNTLIEKQDGPYYAEGSEAYPSIPSTLSDVNTTDTYKGYSWKGWRFSPGGKNKLRRKNLSTEAVEDISITQYAQADGEMDGKVLCMTGDGEWLYLCIDNGTKVEIIAGRDETVDGTTSWVWHPIWEVTTNDCVSMVVHSFSGTKYLFAITGTASDGVDKFTLPQSYSDPLLEVGFECQTEGKFITPWYTTEFVENDKYWDSVWIGGYNFNGITSIKVEYRLEGDGQWDNDDDWTELGYCDADEQGSVTDNGTTRTLVYPSEQVTRFLVERTSRKIQFRLTLATALDGSTDEISPVLTRIRIDGRVEPSLGGISLRKKNIVAAVSLHGSGPLNWATVKGQMADLVTLEAATEPLDFVGPDGQKRRVRFSQVGLSTKLVASPATNKENEFAAILTLEEV